MTTAANTTAPEPTPGWVVAVLGVLLLPLAAGAFILSFEQLWPVMLLGGWSAATAWLGPVVLDITASSGAVMHVVSSDAAVRRWGLGLLLGGTVLSIAGNLAGHNIKTSPGGASRATLPPEMTGWSLPGQWQPVVVALSIAAPTAVAVLVHAFGAVFKAWLATRLATRSASDSTTARRAVPTRLDPTAVADLLPTHSAIRPDSQAESVPDPTLADPTRPASDPVSDLHESDESATRPDPTGQQASDPTAHPTDSRAADPTDPTPTRPLAPDSDPTESADPIPQPTTRPDSESATDPTDPELDRLVKRARELVQSGEIRPTADAIRPALGVGQAKAREIRDILKNDQRHGLRAVS